MSSIEMNMEESNEVRVKNEPICDSQSIPETREAKSQSKLVKEEPIDIGVKAEEKFSATEEFTNKISIAFLNEEIIQATTSRDNQPTTNIQKSKVANDKRLYKCNTCQKVFTRLSGLKNHRRIHTGERPFECNVCNKRFTQSSSLKKHKRIHSEEKPYKCDICNKMFTQSNSLVTHQRIHTGERPYKCDVCEKSFINLSNLVDHLRTHTGEKPYECNVCNKRFTQSNSLKKHKRIHNRN